MYSMPSAHSEQVHHPRSSNTGVSSSICESGGVDYLRVSVWGSWSENSFNRLLLLLQTAQEHGKSQQQESYQIELADGEVWSVLPHGSNSGLRHKFIVRWGTAVITFSGRQVGLKCHPNVQIEMASSHLMTVGHHEKAWREVIEMLGRTGMVLERTTVSRLDLCVDLAGVGMDEFQREIAGGQLIRRARKGSTHWSDPESWETFTLGQKSKVRIYEKRKEVERNPDKMLLMLKRRWGTMPKKAVRVEFELHGKKLEEIGCGRSVEDVFERMGAIVDYFTQDWFRLADKPVDRDGKNQSKPENSDLWNQVVQAFHDWVGESEKELEPVTKSRQTKDQTLACLIGYASKWVAINTVDQQEIDEVVTEMFDFFSSGCFDEGVAIKRLLHGHKSGVIPEESLADIPF